MDREAVRRLARECGFELAGVAAPLPVPDAMRYQGWLAGGMAGQMSYLTDRRAVIRMDPRNLLASVRSVICVGKLYNGSEPYSTRFGSTERGWISRYAWGADYHEVLREGLRLLVEKLREAASVKFDWKICVDTAPLLERSYARQARLGWVSRNTCLINQPLGSWFFLGELLTSLELAPDRPPPDRCGTCTRCIDACPTQAIVPAADGNALDARLCISYFTIELRGEIPPQHRGATGRHVFGCDICQDVCPWNRKAPVGGDDRFRPRHFAPPLDELAALTEEEFGVMFGGTPVARARYSGFLRNVAVAMGNSGRAEFREPLRRLTASLDPVVGEHARWALEKLE